MGLQGDDDAVWLERAAAYREAGRSAEAVETAGRFVSLHPDDPAGLKTLSLALYDAGDVVGAERAARDAVARAPADEHAWRVLSLVLRCKGDLGGAVMAANQAVAIDPGNWRCHAMAAFAFMTPRAVGPFERATGSFEQVTAVRAATRAVELAPHEPEAHLQLARALVVAGRNAPAMVELQTVLRLDPHNDDAHYLIGAVERQSHHFGRAARSSLSAVTLSPDQSHYVTLLVRSVADQVWWLLVVTSVVVSAAGATLLARVTACDQGTCSAAGQVPVAVGAFAVLPALATGIVQAWRLLGRVMRFMPVALPVVLGAGALAVVVVPVVSVGLALTGLVQTVLFGTVVGLVTLGVVAALATRFVRAYGWAPTVRHLRDDRWLALAVTGAVSPIAPAAVALAVPSVSAVATLVAVVLLVVAGAALLAWRRRRGSSAG